MTKPDDLDARKQKLEEQIVELWLNKKISINMKEKVLEELANTSNKGYLPLVEKSIASGTFIKEGAFSDALYKRINRVPEKEIDVQSFISAAPELYYPSFLKYDQTIDSLVNKKLIERTGKGLRPHNYIDIDLSTIDNLSDDDIFIYEKFIKVFERRND